MDNLGRIRYMRYENEAQIKRFIITSLKIAIIGQGVSLTLLMCDSLFILKFLQNNIRQCKQITVERN